MSKNLNYCLSIIVNTELPIRILLLFWLVSTIDVLVANIPYVTVMITLASQLMFSILTIQQAQNVVVADLIIILWRGMKMFKHSSPLHNIATI